MRHHQLKIAVLDKVTGDNLPGDNSPPPEITPYRKYSLEVTPDPRVLVSIKVRKLNSTRPFISSTQMFTVPLLRHNVILSDTLSM